jgi:hypothetical protein
MVTKTGKFENIGENFLIFDMNLGSYISLENEFSKSIPSFYKNYWKHGLFVEEGGIKVHTILEK